MVTYEMILRNKKIDVKIKFAYILLKHIDEYVILSSRLGGMIWKGH